VLYLSHSLEPTRALQNAGGKENGKKFYLDRVQPIEKSRIGRIKPSKSKQFYLVLFGWAWHHLANSLRS
jgi:hypothetical protein